MEIAWLTILVVGGDDNGMVNVKTVVDDNSDDGLC